MPAGIPKPTLATFLQSARWTVSRYMLSRVGSARHDIRFVLPPSGPFILRTTDEPVDAFAGVHLVERFVDFSRIGAVCVSATSPSIREIVFSASISEASPLYFGRSTTLRTGFPEPDSFGAAKSFTCRVDYTAVFDRQAPHADLLLLVPGRVAYPLLAIGGAGVYHKALYEARQDQLSRDSVPLAVFTQGERTEITTAFDALAINLTLDLAMVLDSEELLAFHWSVNSGRFEEDFYNAGIVGAP